MPATLTHFIRKDQRMLSLYTAVSAFGVYSCMYAFRKPYTAATFDGYLLWGMHLKVWLVIAQTCGYALSKFYGIRFIAELRNSGRRQIILLLIAIAWFALLGFAFVPPPWNVLFLFVNGIPLGMVFGVVFSYLEGRRSTEFLGATLASSFVFSSGVVKSAGKWMMVTYGVSAFWMPFVTGALFILPMLAFSWLLEQTPPPDAADLLARNERKPMKLKNRRQFLHLFRNGLIPLVLVYVLLTVLRDVRDNFSAEIWVEQGYGSAPAIFTQTELPVTVIVLVVMSMLVLVRNNFRALFLNHVLVISGFAFTLVSTIAFQRGLINAPLWFTLNGLGLYLGYIPFNCLLFDRLLSAFRYPGNVGFIMYVADTFGYLGSVSVLFVKEMTELRWSWSSFFQTAATGVSLLSIGMMAVAWYFFYRKMKNERDD